MPGIVENSPNVDQQPVLGRLMSGESVIDRHQSHLHLDPQILTVALARVDSQGQDFVREAVELSEQAGFTTCVETGPEDEIVYASRIHRDGPTRFVLNREPLPTNKVSVILKRTEEPSTMVLISAWLGELAPPEPWDERATPASPEFWAKHALIWSSEPIDSSKPIEQSTSSGRGAGAAANFK